MRQFLLGFLCCLVAGCRGHDPYVEPVHEWKDFGNTISMNIERGGLITSGTATITTTKGSFISHGEAPNPFVVGAPVRIRDDACWAKVGDETIRLYAN